jgi:hypothetical protein
LKRFNGHDCAEFSGHAQLHSFVSCGHMDNSSLFARPVAAPATYSKIRQGTFLRRSLN